MSAAPSLSREELQREIAARDWYHTLELAPGLVTPGWFDLREMVDRVPFPPSLEDRRCLDVGTFDGFWAFEMERRGAREVVATDVLDPRRWDWPAGSEDGAVEAIGRRKGRGDGFAVAKGALGSSVRRLELSVYDLDPEEIGRFDLVYLGSLLIHLRDPIGALERVRAICSGVMIVCDAVDAPLTALLRRLPTASLDGRGRPWWWKPNLAALVRMVEAAGFELERRPARLRMPPGAGHPGPPRKLRPYLHRIGREEAMRAWRGDPHAILVARPAVN